MFEHKPFREVLEKSSGISICIGYNRYGGGWVALPIDQDGPNPIDLFFTSSDNDHAAGCNTLQALQIPWATGATPEEAMASLMIAPTTTHCDGDEVYLENMVRHVTKLLENYDYPFWYSFSDKSKEEQIKYLKDLIT